MLLHIFVLYTLFTCQSDLQLGYQQGSSLYLRSFLSLLFLNSALYVALNLSDPGFIGPSARSQQPGSKILEARDSNDLPIQMAGRVPAAGEERHKHCPSKRESSIFDLGSLLDNVRPSGATARGEGSSTADQCKEARYALEAEESRHECTSVEEDMYREDPASDLLHHLSDTSAMDGHPVDGISSRTLSSGEDCLAGSSLSSWADDLPFSPSQRADKAPQRASLSREGKARSAGHSNERGELEESARTVLKLQARAESTECEDLIPAGHLSRMISEASQASSR